MLIINDFNILLKDNENKTFASWPCLCFNYIRITVKGLQKLKSYFFSAFIFIGLNLFLINYINAKEKKKIRERPKGKKQTGPEVLCGAPPK